jgi:hypothetical protein
MSTQSSDTLTRLVIKQASLDTLRAAKARGLISLSNWLGKSTLLGSHPVAMHKKNIVHFGFITSLNRLKTVNLCATSTLLKFNSLARHNIDSKTQNL